MKLIPIVLLMCSVQAMAQSAFKIGTQIPLQYTVGYEYQFHKKWSANLNAGVLTKPYDQIILDVLKSFGVEQSIVNVISNAFNFGTVVQGGANCHFGKNYVGANASYIFLKAADTPVSAIESAFNVQLTSYPLRSKQSSPATTLTLASDLYAAGILYGRRFTFKNPKLEFRAEFSFSKVLGSSSTLDSPQRSLESLSKQIDQELNTDYVNYGFLPTINAYLVYKFNQ